MDDTFPNRQNMVELVAHCKRVANLHKMYIVTKNFRHLLYRDTGLTKGTFLGEARNAAELKALVSRHAGVEV